MGGGIAGLSAAIALQRAGIDAQVFERRDSLRRGRGAILLWSNALNAYGRLGLGEAVAAAGTILEHTEFRAWDGRPLSTLPIGAMSRRAGAPSIAIHRERLLDVLAAGVGEEKIRFGRAAAGLEEAGAEIRLSFEGQADPVHGRILIGADGLNSRIRDHLIGDGPPRWGGHRAWGGTGALPLRGDAPVGTSTVTHGRGARIWYAPTKFGDCVWIAIVGDRLLPSGGERLGPEPLFRAFAGAHSPIPEILRSTPASEMFETRIRHRPTAERWGRGPMTLLGDAAHPMPPDLAQAAGQAAEDAATLMRSLQAHSDDWSTALRAYERERLRRRANVANLSRLALLQGGEDSALLCALRDLGTDILLRTVARRQLWDLLGHRS